MFGIFKVNPVKKLEKQHALKLEQAMHAQRNGDIRLYSQLTAEAEDIYSKIKEIESSIK
ncbi:MAG: Lacal_2735 family protein [Gammaproteobacteria bacterium]|nr:Lacal_2735 family protein [Gammaproteobacteria bacterium]